MYGFQTKESIMYLPQINRPEWIKNGTKNLPNGQTAGRDKWLKGWKDLKQTDKEISLNKGVP